MQKENIEKSLSTGRKLHRIFSTIFLPLYCARRLQTFATPRCPELSRNDQALSFYPRIVIYLHASTKTLEICFQVIKATSLIISLPIEKLISTNNFLVQDTLLAKDEYFRFFIELSYALRQKRKRREKLYTREIRFWIMTGEYLNDGSVNKWFMGRINAGFKAAFT